MRHSDRVREWVRRIHAAGGAEFVERDPGSGVYCWRVPLGKWPFEVQADRFAVQIRCYVGDELFCTGRLQESDVDELMAPRSGGGDGAALQELAAFVDGVLKADSRRFLRPPHADRHPDRRSDARQGATIRALPGRAVKEPT